MTRTTLFDPSRELIFVRGTLKGPRREADLLLVLATGASSTTVASEILDRIGFDVRDGERTTAFVSTMGSQDGYRIEAERFASLGFAVHKLEVCALDLATSDGVDGIIGLNFLKHFNVEVHSQAGLIRLSSLAA